VRGGCTEEGEVGVSGFEVRARPGEKKSWGWLSTRRGRCSLSVRTIRVGERLEEGRGCLVGSAGQRAGVGTRVRDERGSTDMWGPWAERAGTRLRAAHR
jgi:hypothetical protein